MEILPDVHHLPKALSLLDQKALVKIYLESRSEFYQPKLKSGHNMNLKMLCFGKHWNPIDYQYYPDRRDFDKKIVSSLPLKLSELATKFLLQTFPNHEAVWDLCVVNYYAPGSSLGLHVDNSEKLETLQSGHPIVSFSVGASAVFNLGGLDRKDEIKDVLLESGDVIIFGNTSRLRYHGVSKIEKALNTPLNSLLGNGRLNFTLRKY